MTSPRSGASAATATPHDNVPQGILLMCFAVLLWVIHDAIAKLLAERYSIFQVFFLRSVVSLLPILLMLHVRREIPRLASPRLAALIGRGVLGIIAFTTFLGALRLMSLADAFAIGLSTPLLITALSVPLLGERVGARRWVAVAAGFAATLVILRPGGDIPPLGAGLMAVSVVFYALAMITARPLGRSETALTMAFYSSIAYVIFGACTAPAVWNRPAALDLLLMVAIGLIAGVAQTSMTQAFRIAPPAAVAPFEYTSIVWAILLGYLIWGDVPTLTVMACAALIIASGLYALHREAATSRAAP